MRALGVFDYITMRAVLACATALLIGLVFGPKVIRKLTEMKIGQAVRAYGPQTHLVKTGTPTMGGALDPDRRSAISTLLWADWSNRFVWVVLLVTFGFGLDRLDGRLPQGGAPRPRGHAGAAEVLLAGHRSGWSPRSIWRSRVSAPANTALWPLFTAWVGSGLTMPAAHARRPDRALLQERSAIRWACWVSCALTWSVIVGTSNAVNLTDGLDGLAIMPTVMVGAALGIFAYVIGRADYSKYLLFPCIPGAARADWCCARRSAGRAWRFCGSTPIRRRCSWATWARWRWAARWAPSP